ncbi:MAG TPA: tetratricopeptide repeat protein, partial [Pyrinomonadaceae bacterium]|nr:tetratricopeptide repeat protein [Pyrinomonadaceae bacterium]
VLARPATVSYRASKFYRRNRVSVWAAALILISLFAGIAVAVSQADAARAQARIAAEAQRQAELETARAKAEKQKAERTSRFMQSFLEYANPHWYGRGNGRMDVTVREAIDDAAARIDTELADEPEVRADLHYSIGEIYRVSGDTKTAHMHFRQSLALYRQVHGEEHPKVARGMYYVSLGIELSGASAEEAAQLLRQGIAVLRRVEPGNVNLPYMLQSLAGQQMFRAEQDGDESRLAEAESLILESKSLFIPHYGEDHVATVTVSVQQAELARLRGDLKREEQLREEINRRLERIEGRYHYVMSLAGLAQVKLALGKRAEAETLFAQALKLAHSLWRADDVRLARLVKYISTSRAAARKYNQPQP